MLKQRQTDHNRILWILTTDACVKIRALRINKRKTHRGKNKKPSSDDVEPRSVNHSNLTQVNITNDKRVRKFTKQLNIVLINPQSIRNKDELIAEYLISNNIDACILTETWLTNSDNDKIWLECREVQQNGYKISNINRKDRKGEGLAIIYKNHLKVNVEKSGATQFFKYALCTLSTTSSRTNILAIYHPPYSEKNPITNNIFLDDFAEFIADVPADHRNILILCDFNIHINNKDDPDVEVFSDMMEALGLNQHINFSTHRSDNTLDLVFTEAISSLKVLECSEGSYISDHRAIQITLSVPRDDTEKKIIKTRNLKTIRTRDLIANMKLDEIQDTNVDMMVTEMELRMKKAFNEIHPETMKKVTIRKNNPWYNGRIKEQKIIV